MLRWGRWEITPGFVLLLAWLIYGGDSELVALTLLAAGAHELGHYLAIDLSGARVTKLTVTAAGAKMKVEGRLSYGRELICAAAGPTVNLLAAMFAAKLMGARGYVFAGINVVLGVLNLLPVSGLDGGRCLLCAVSCLFGPVAGERICRRVSRGAVAVGLLLGGAQLYLGGRPALLFVFGCLIWMDMGEFCIRRMKKGLPSRSITAKMVHV